MFPDRVLSLSYSRSNMAPNPPSPFSASFDARCGSSEPEELPSTQHHAVQSLPSERSTRSSSYPRFGRSSGPKTQNPKGNSLPRALSRLRSHPPNPAPAQVSIKEHVYATLSFPRSRNQSRPTIHDGPPRGYPMNSLWHQDVNVWQDSNHASSLGRKTNGNAVPITGSLQYSGRLTPGYATPIPSGRDPDEDEIPGSGWSTKELESTLCFGRIPGRSRRVEWNEDPPERFEYGHRSRREASRRAHSQKPPLIADCLRLESTRSILDPYIPAGAI